ncbi:hypothetical protein BGZ89_012668 [Linnemannia elongata]|nr:hypothetical protein BGZ89_012668 [Linnemannia elongata]
MLMTKTGALLNSAADVFDQVVLAASQFESTLSPAAMSVVKGFMGNDVLSAGFFLMIIGSSYKFSKDLIIGYYREVQSCFYVSIVVKEGDQLYNWLSDRISERPFTNSVRHLPPEILERIVYFANGYVMCVLGINPYGSSLARNGMFLSGGPGVALDQIFLHGGDPRALLTVHRMGEGVTPAELVIAKAVATRSPKILARVFAIWGTTESDIGLHTSMMLDFRFGVDNITCSPDNRYIVGYRNVYYINRGVYDRIHEDVDVLYASHPDIDGGLPATEDAYDKMYPHASSYWKMRMALRMGRMENVYQLLDSGERWRAFNIEYLSVDNLIGIYNRYGPGLRGRRDKDTPGDILVALCGKVSTLEELDGIHDKSSPGYIQASRYLLGTPGYIHSMFTGIALDTHRHTALENIIGSLPEGDIHSSMYVVDAMISRGWTQDMIADKFGDTRGTPVGYGPEVGRMELFLKGLMSLDELLLSESITTECLKELDPDVIHEIIHHPSSEVFVESVDGLLWMWRTFDDEMGSVEKETSYLYVSQVNTNFLETSTTLLTKQT